MQLPGSRGSARTLLDIQEVSGRRRRANIWEPPACQTWLQMRSKLRQRYAGSSFAPLHGYTAVLPVPAQLAPPPLHSHSQLAVPIASLLHVGNLQSPNSAQLYANAVVAWTKEKAKRNSIAFNRNEAQSSSIACEACGYLNRLEGTKNASADWRASCSLVRSGVLGPQPARIDETWAAGSCALVAALHNCKGIPISSEEAEAKSVSFPTNCRPEDRAFIRILMLLQPNANTKEADDPGGVK